MPSLKKIRSSVNYFKWKKWCDRNYVSDTSPIIIGGCGRSGTTLFQIMIDSHPQVCIGEESSLFQVNLENDFNERPTGKLDWNLLSHRFDIEVDLIKRMRQETRSQAEFIEKFFIAYAKMSAAI